MGHFPVGMEQFSAADEEQWEIIKQTIDTSDYYVLIIGHRYGSVISSGEDEGISYTEKEYRYAHSTHVPILAFLPDTSVPLDAKDRESDILHDKLEQFTSTVKSNKLIDYWKNSDDLAAKVTASLYKQFDRTERPGWVREGSSEQSLQVITDLHKRMKELEKENSELRKNVTIRRPELVITISCEETLEEAEDKFRDWHNSENRESPLFDSSDDGMTVYMKHIPKTGHLGRTDQLSIDDVPDHLRAYVSEESLKAYNDDLPDQSTVTAFDSAMYRYCSVKENGVVLKVGIFNDGNVKATDIHVEIEFSESFILIDKEDAIDLASPRRPEMPDDPIEVAEKEYYRKTNKARIPYNESLENMLRLMGNSMQGCSFATPARSAVLAKSVRSLNAGWSVWVEGSCAHIRKDDLLHTYEWNRGEFVIAPTEAGDFTVRITAICEELTEPVESEYKIKVVDMGW